MARSRNLQLWAVLVPMLLVAAVGIRDFGGAFFDQRKLGEAAFEGAKWGKAHGFDAAQIATVAQSATRLDGISVAPARPCGCADGATIRQGVCDATCPGGGWSQPYIVVTTSRCYEPTLAWPGVSYCSASNSQCAAIGCTPKQVVLSSQSVALQ
jgi:hypothetical protein